MENRGGRKKEKRLRNLIEDMLRSCLFSEQGFKWLDERQKIFQLPWKINKKSKPSDNDGQVLAYIARTMWPTREKLSDWKGLLRNDLANLDDFEELKDQASKQENYKVYRIVDNVRKAKRKPKPSTARHDECFNGHSGHAVGCLEPGTSNERPLGYAATKSPIGSYQVVFQDCFDSIPHSGHRSRSPVARESECPLFLGDQNAGRWIRGTDCRQDFAVPDTSSNETFLATVLNGWENDDATTILPHDQGFGDSSCLQVKTEAGNIPNLTEFGLPCLSLDNSMSSSSASSSQQDNSTVHENSSGSSEPEYLTLSGSMNIFDALLDPPTTLAPIPVALTNSTSKNVAQIVPQANPWMFIATTRQCGELSNPQTFTDQNTVIDATAAPVICYDDLLTFIEGESVDKQEPDDQSSSVCPTQVHQTFTCVGFDAGKTQPSNETHSTTYVQMDERPRETPSNLNEHQVVISELDVTVPPALITPKKPCMRIEVRYYTECILNQYIFDPKVTLYHGKSSLSAGVDVGRKIKLPDLPDCYLDDRVNSKVLHRIRTVWAASCLGVTIAMENNDIFATRRSKSVVIAKHLKSPETKKLDRWQKTPVFNYNSSFIPAVRQRRDLRGSSANRLSLPSDTCRLIFGFTHAFEDDEPGALSVYVQHMDAHGMVCEALDLSLLSLDSVHSAANSLDEI